MPKWNESGDKCALENNDLGQTRALLVMHHMRKAKKNLVVIEKNLPIRPIFMPARASALKADWAPGPGVFVLFPPVALSLICKAVIPSSYNATSEKAITTM